jgi:glycosyltransferase involved in cell wall biosynthesis
VKTVRLAIVSTHPIQYYAPIFQALTLSASLQTRVFYTWSQTAAAGVPDRDFGQVINWDIPLLEGYESQFVPNIARQPGTHHFGGIHNPQLNSAIEHWGADALLIFGWNSRTNLRALRHFKGKIPVFFRGDSTLLNRSTALRTLARRALLRWIYKHVDVAIAVGANNRDYYRWCGIPDDRIAFAPHAIDTARFGDSGGLHRAKALQWRQELGIAPSARVALYAGKLMPVKNPLLLLEAFIASGSSGHLVYVGNGALESELRRRSAGRQDVHFLPFQNQLAMPAVYRLGDLFVLPSLSETWGLSLNEAMACGRALIASSQVGGARDLVTPGTNGWVFESGNGTALTQVLRQGLTCDDRELQAMGEVSRREVSRWSTDEAALGIERAVLAFARTRGGRHMSFA